MAHELVVALEVVDDAAYDRYRAAMRPILAEYGGGFRYDFRVAEVLASEAGAAINRVFTIHFDDRAASERFFADPRYRAVKSEHFEGAVAATTILGAYDR